MDIEDSSGMDEMMQKDYLKDNEKRLKITSQNCISVLTAQASD